MEVSASLAAWGERMSMMLLPTVDAFLAFLSEDPLLRGLQLLLLGAASLLIFSVFFATRDILHRTKSLFYQVSCIVLVAALPFAGFLLYLLIRPSQTLEERELQRNLRQILNHLENSERKPAMKSFSPRPQMTPHAVQRPLPSSVRPAPIPSSQKNFEHRPVPALASS